MLADVRAILRLAWPILIGQLAIIAFGALDTAMVGRYSSLDLAALGLGGSIYVTIYIGLTGILVALSPIAGQAFGAKRYFEIGEWVRQSAWLALALAALGMSVLAFPEPLLHLAHAPTELAERAGNYLRYLSFGLPAALAFRIYNSLSTAIGKPRLVMTVQLVALALKVPANLWFIFGGWGLPALGGPGCALASTSINWMTAIIGAVVMARGRSYRSFGIFAHFSWPQGSRQAALLRLGVPMGLSYLIEVTAYTFMALFIVHFGTTVLAAHQIAGNVGAILYMTPLSIGIASSTLVAQALGAGRPDAARAISRHGIAFAAALAMVYALAVWAGQSVIARLYTPERATVAAAGSLLVIVAFYHFCDAIQVSTAFILRAYKVTVIPTLIYALALWGVGLGGGYWLGFNVPGWVPPAWSAARGFWLANSISLGLAGIFLLGYRWVVVRRRMPRDSAPRQARG